MILALISGKSYFVALDRLSQSDHHPISVVAVVGVESARVVDIRKVRGIAKVRGA